MQLKIMTNRLKNALNGQDVDFQDTSKYLYRHSPGRFADVQFWSWSFVRRWRYQWFRKRHVHWWDMSPKPVRQCTCHCPTRSLPIPSRKQGGESLGYSEPPLHHHQPAFAARFAAPAIIVGRSTNWDWDWDLGVGESLEGGEWGIVTLPKLNMSICRKNKNILGGLAFGFALEQRGINDIHKCFCSALLFLAILWHH